jgi:hypothetical protein
MRLADRFMTWYVALSPVSQLAFLLLCAWVLCQVRATAGKRR